MERQQFLSLRWRFLLPLYIVVLVIVTLGAYLLAANTGAGVAISPTNVILQNRRAIIQQATTLYESQRRAAQTAAFVNGVPQALVAGRVSSALQQSLENRTQRTGLDGLILIDADGIEVLGLRQAAGASDFVATTGSDFSAEAVVRAAITGQDAAGFVIMADESLLVAAVPISQDGDLLGVALAGHRLNWVLATLQTSALSELSLYRQSGAPLVTTLADDSVLPLAAGVFDDALRAVQHETLTIGEADWQGLYFPFDYGPETVGVVGVMVPQGLGFGFGRQLAGLVLAMLAATVAIVAFVGISWVTRRIERVSRTAEALAAGQFTARTGMRPTDEIGALGRALDTYADYSQARQDSLRTSLRRQRRENERLIAVLDTLPDGVVVQDLDGQVVVMNETARTLLGSDRLLRSNADLKELTALVTDRLGPALAPGIYALGDAQELKLDSKIVSAQAAAVLTVTDQRIGSVIVLRDISEEARLAEARKALLQQIEGEVQTPLADLAAAIKPAPMKEVARDIRQHTASLQKMVLAMRELTGSTRGKVAEQDQHPILLDTLVWAVANEWRQVAQAQNLKLHVVIEQSGLYVLGQERHLRWALGNIVDNAIKYTPPGGDLMIEIQDDTAEGRAHLRVRDNGVGIDSDELSQVFTRFYRGKPITKDGRALHVPGSGQGLTMARQIFEAHGGALTLKSKQWVGTGAYCTIPLTSPVSLELPQVAEDLEGETVRIKVTKHDQKS